MKLQSTQLVAVVVLTLLSSLHLSYILRYRLSPHST